MNSTKRMIGLILLCVIAGTVVYAQRTIPVNLERMVKQSGAIVHATVAGTECARDPRTHLLYTNVKLDVKESFYGVSGAQYSFRQYGGSENGRHFYPDGMVHFKQGDEIIVMLYAKSSTGLQSPVGMKQGVFAVTTGPQSSGKVVANAMENRGLFTGVKTASVLSKKSGATTANPGPIDFNEFTQVLRTLVQQLKK